MEAWERGRDAGVLLIIVNADQSEVHNNIQALGVRGAFAESALRRHECHLDLQLTQHNTFDACQIFNCTLSY